MQLTFDNVEEVLYVEKDREQKTFKEWQSSKNPLYFLCNNIEIVIHRCEECKYVVHILHSEPGRQNVCILFFLFFAGITGLFK